MQACTKVDMCSSHMAESGIWPSDFAWGPASSVSTCCKSRKSNYICCHRRLELAVPEAHQTMMILPQRSCVAIGTVAALRQL